MKKRFAKHELICLYELLCPMQSFIDHQSYIQKLPECLEVHALFLLLLFAHQDSFKIH